MPSQTSQVQSPTTARPAVSPLPPPTSSRNLLADFIARRRAQRWRSDDDTPDSVPPGSRTPPKRPRSRSALTLLRAFLGLTRGRRAWIALSLATLAVSTVIGLSLPASTKLIFDYIILDTPGPSALPDPFSTMPRTTLLVLIGLCLVALATVDVTAHMLGRWHMTRLTKRLAIDLRRKVFDHAVNLPLHRVHELKSGGAASILREDAGGAAELLFHAIYNPFRAIIKLIGTLAILAVIDGFLLLGGLALIPIVFLTHRTWISRIRPVHREARRARTAIDAHATEAFGGMRVVRAFGRHRGEANRFLAGNLYMSRLEILAWWWSRAIDISWALLIPIATTAALVYGGSRILENDLTVGDVMMFLAFVMSLLGPLEVLAVTATELQQKLAGLDRVLDLLEEPREFEGTRGTVRITPAAVRGHIRFENVSFAYPARVSHAASKPQDSSPAQPVLQGITLDVPAGAMVALVGPSGAGKTTLCNLAARFHDPTTGRITLDGTDVRDIHLDDFRGLLGVVEQDVFLFDGTIRQNIAYARPDAPLQAVIHAATIANAHRFITTMEQGYDTVIGERGVRLSGGQKQRIAIARAVLADPRILILDEATSNLDTESERLIQASLAQIFTGRTSFVIAHRLSTITAADIIVVLEHGRIVESGTHDQLVARDQRYAHLVRLQTALQNTAETTAIDPGSRP